MCLRRAPLALLTLTALALPFPANVSTGCTKSVFAKVYDQAVGDTAWTFLSQSACYTITGTSSFDTKHMTVTGLPRNCYNFRIDLLECSGTQVKATRGPADDKDLTNQCFEPL